MSLEHNTMEDIEKITKNVDLITKCIVDVNSKIDELDKIINKIKELFDDESLEETCPYCDGTGTLPSYTGVFSTCPTCQGTGVINTKGE